MAKTGINRIDTLFDNAAAPTVVRGDADSEAVGVLQDLLIGHGARLPGIRGAGRGNFGPQTEGAVAAFQGEHDLPINGVVDHQTVRTLADVPAISPIAAQAYLTLVLDQTWGGLTRLVALTAQFEAAGKFTARNRNTDRAGLSFGIIQWAQKPGRLNEILRAFQRAQPDRFVAVFGDGNAKLAENLLKHTAKPMGGVDKVGSTTDPAFDLVNDVWNARFIEAGRDRVWQQTQLRVAMAAYNNSLNRIQTVAPIARSERALAFLLDVANQHGDGGLKNICVTATTPDMDEPTFLGAVQDESVRRLEAQFGATSSEAHGTLDRREFFRTTPLLADTVFQDA